MAPGLAGGGARGSIRPGEARGASFCLGKRRAQLLPAEAPRPEDQKQACPAVVDQRGQTEWRPVPRAQTPRPGDSEPSPGRRPSRPATVMEASEWVLQAVQKLQVRLAAATRPKKLRRYLERLSALPVTPHILVETGVRKTVKSLRKHQLVGSLARDLAARWKKLSLLERAPGRGPHDSQHSLSPKRPGDALAQENLHPGSQATWRGPGSPSDPPGHGHQEHGEPWRSHRAHQSSPSRQRRPGSKKHPRLAARPSHWGSSGCGPAQASRRATSPPPTSGDPPEPSAPGHGPAQGRLPYSPDETLLLQARPLSGPQEEEDLWPRAQEMDGNQENPPGQLAILVSFGQGGIWNPRTPPPDKGGPWQEGGRGQPKLGSFQPIMPQGQEEPWDWEGEVPPSEGAEPGSRHPFPIANVQWHCLPSRGALPCPAPLLAESEAGPIPEVCSRAALGYFHPGAEALSVTVARRSKARR